MLLNLARSLMVLRSRVLHVIHAALLVGYHCLLHWMMQWPHDTVSMSMYEIATQHALALPRVFLDTESYVIALQSCASLHACLAKAKTSCHSTWRHPLSSLPCRRTTNYMARLADPSSLRLKGLTQGPPLQRPGLSFSSSKSLHQRMTPAHFTSS